MVDWFIVFLIFVWLVAYVLKSYFFLEALHDIMCHSPSGCGYRSHFFLLHFHVFFQTKKDRYFTWFFLIIK